MSVSIATGGVISTITTGAGVTDWSSSEREQIRSALGIDGTKKDTKDSELSPMQLLPFTV